MTYEERLARFVQEAKESGWRPRNAADMPPGFPKPANGEARRPKKSRPPRTRQAPVTTERKALDCVNLGEPMSPEAARDAGLGVIREWRPCSAGHGEKNKPAGFVACCLSGTVCTSSCVDYKKKT